MPAKNPDLYYCNKDKCDARSKHSKFVSHSLTCLLKRVLSNAVESNFSMTLVELIDDICGEFPYFEELRQQNEHEIKRSFIFNLYSNKGIYFLYDRKLKKYTLIESMVEKLKKKLNKTSAMSDTDSQKTVTETSSTGKAKENERDSETSNLSNFDRKQTLHKKSKQRRRLEQKDDGGSTDAESDKTLYGTPKRSGRLRKPRKSPKNNAPEDDEEEMYFSCDEDSDYNPGKNLHHSHSKHKNVFFLFARQIIRYCHCWK